MREIKAIFIGASAGGVSAIQQILKNLPPRFSIPIIVVLHLPHNAKIEPSLAFGASTDLTVFEAFDKMSLNEGSVYFAPPGYHLLVEKDFSFALSQDDPVHYSRPSIDVLFESAANAFGRNACAILLTGANSDGATGLKFFQESGGITMVQDPKDAESSMMPIAALKIMKPSFTGSILQITEKLLNFDSLEAV